MYSSNIRHAMVVLSNLTPICFRSGEQFAHRLVLGSYIPWDSTGGSYMVRILQDLHQHPTSLTVKEGNNAHERVMRRRLRHWLCTRPDTRWRDFMFT